MQTNFSSPISRTPAKNPYFHSDDYLRKLFVSVSKKYLKIPLHIRINLKSSLIGSPNIYNLEDLIYHLYKPLVKL